ncbi:MAG: sugar phosphate nucleotidyltransferase [Oscillospiraceae bacterium]
MKAIVMAGGEGTRLRPVTSGRPKPMVELLGKPLLEHTIELLKKYGIKEICFTLRYLPKTIEDYFSDGSGFGVKIISRVEEQPLGTAGSVRACADFIGDEDFLVISGDAVCDFDLSKCIEFHKEKNAEATLVLYEHPEPTEYGLVVTDSDGRIKSFVEKPAWDMVMTNRINTGIYILSPSVLKDIAPGEAFDFGRDLFPKLLKEGRRLYGFCAEGYWCDVGSPQSYRECCSDVISGRTKINIDAPERAPGIWSKQPVPPGVRLTAPVYIGDGCALMPGAQIGPECVISSGSTVMQGARIKNSVINGACVKENAKITGAIVGRGAAIGEHAEIGEGCVIGDEARIGCGCQVSPGVKIWTSRRTAPGEVIKRSITGSCAQTAPGFSADGRISGEFPTELTPEMAMAFGGVIGSYGRIGAAYTGGEAARLFMSAVGCGATGAGGEYYELDCRFEAELAGACRTFALSAAVFIRQEGLKLTLSFLGEDGTPVKTETQRKLTAAAGGEYPRVSGLAVGGVTRISGADRAYAAELMEAAKNIGALGGINRVSVSGGGAENRALRSILEGLGYGLAGRTAGVPDFTVCSGGMSLRAVTEDGEQVGTGKMLAVTADAAYRCGVKELAVPYAAPAVLERVAGKHRGRLLRTVRDEPQASELFGKQLFIRDGIFAAVTILAAMELEGMSLSELCAETPKFAVASRRVDVACSRAKAMRILAGSCSEMAKELTCGLSVDTERGRAHISPCRDGSALMIRGEASTEEIAEELCSDFEKLAGHIEESNHMP